MSDISPLRQGKRRTKLLFHPSCLPPKKCKAKLIFFLYSLPSLFFFLLFLGMRYYLRRWKKKLFFKGFIHLFCASGNHWGKVFSLWQEGGKTEGKGWLAGCKSFLFLLPFIKNKNKSQRILKEKVDQKVTYLLAFLHHIACKRCEINKCQNKNCWEKHLRDISKKKKFFFNWLYCLSEEFSISHSSILHRCTTISTYIARFSTVRNHKDTQKTQKNLFASTLAWFLCSFLELFFILSFAVKLLLLLRPAKSFFDFTEKYLFYSSFLLFANFFFRINFFLLLLFTYTHEEYCFCMCFFWPTNR